MQPNRRQFIVASGVALAGTGALSGTAAAETSDAPAPDDPEQYDYPVTTEDPEAPVATVYGGFDCPYTADMVAESLRDVLEEFVEPGRLTLRFRPLEYDQNGEPYIGQDGVIAGQAAGGVWQEDPDSFWDFFAAVYDEMPGDMSKSKIERIMEDAGVDDASYIADNLENWDLELRETADDAYAEGVEWTPTIELKGDLGNREDVVEWIEARLEDDGGQQGSQDTEEDESQQSQASEEEAEQDDSESGSVSGEEDSGTSDDAQQVDADADQASSGEQSESGNEQSGSSDGDSESTDGSSGTDGTSADDSDGGSDGSNGSNDSGSSGGSGGTGGGGGSFSCGDGNQASHASHGGSSQTTQSFVFPEASGSRRVL